MSQVLLLTADKALPLCDKQSERTKTFAVSGETFSVTTLCGFKVTAHGYYRSAVEELGHDMKPYRYELELEQCEEDLIHLLSYLRENFARGEEAELWNLWVGDDASRPMRFRGELSDFDMDTLAQFLHPSPKRSSTGECCMTITI